MKTIPEGWSPIPLSKAGSGIAARLSLLREASMNANFLYGGKVMEGGWSANKWNKVGEQFTVEFTATGNGTKKPDLFMVGINIATFKFSFIIQELWGNSPIIYYL